MTKRILLISYHFPPSQAVGGLRIYNLAKHLPKFGWDVEVLTIKSKYLKYKDHSRLKDISDVKIHKSRILPTMVDFYLKMKSYYYSFKQFKLISLEDLQKNYTPDPIRKNKKGAWELGKEFVISVFLSLPDNERGWIIPATLRGLRLLKKKRFDFILTTCPPYSVHLIGLILNKVTGVPWVADFRDPWSKGSHKKLYLTTNTSKFIEEKLENLVLNRADLLLTTTKNLCDLFEEFLRNKIGVNKTNKCRYQNNGYDETFISNILIDGKFEKFTITYTGSLYFGRTPEPVFKAVSQLIGNDDINSDQIAIKLIGNCDKVENKPIKPIIQQYKLQNIVELSEPVPYAKSIEIVKKSHLALLLAPDQPLQIPAKAFDYIGAGTPILTITQQGATFDLIQSAGLGGAFHPDDTEGIKRFILESMNGISQENNIISKENMDKFTSRSLAANIGLMLDEILEK